MVQRPDVDATCHSSNLTNEIIFKLKDNQLEEYLQALSRIKPSTREVSVNTENAIGIGSSSPSTLEALRKQFDEKIAAVTAHFKASEEKKFLALEAKHKVCKPLLNESFF